MALLVEVIVDIGMDRSEVLQRLHLPEPQHCPLSSPEGQVGVLDPVVRPAGYFLLVGIAEVSHGCLVGTQPVGSDGFWRSVAL